MTNSLIFILDKWCDFMELFFNQPIDYLAGIIGLILALVLFYAAGTIIITCLQHTFVPRVIKLLIRGILAVSFICISPILFLIVNRKLLIKKLYRLAAKVMKGRDL